MPLHPYPPRQRTRQHSWLLLLVLSMLESKTIDITALDMLDKETLRFTLQWKYSLPLIFPKRVTPHHLQRILYKYHSFLWKTKPLNDAIRLQRQCHISIDCHTMHIYSIYSHFQVLASPHRKRSMIDHYQQIFIGLHCDESPVESDGVKLVACIVKYFYLL